MTRYQLNWGYGGSQELIVATDGDRSSDLAAIDIR
jgi:hypothetical protein